jgi:hypothetical protein
VGESGKNVIFGHQNSPKCKPTVENETHTEDGGTKAAEVEHDVVEAEVVAGVAVVGQQDGRKN